MTYKYSNYLEIIFQLIKKDLKIRYKNSVLGYFWAIANPIVFSLVYYFAFKIILRSDIPNYSFFLLCGIFPWIWVNGALFNGANSFRTNSFLVKRTAIPKLIIPFSVVLHEAVHFLFALPILLIFMLITNESFYLSYIFFIPLLIFFQTLFLYSITITLAIINVFIQDIEYIVSLGLSILFFLTPIIYPISLVPDKYLVIYNLNPLVHLISCWKSVFFYGELPLSSFIYIILFSMLGFLISFFFYKKFKNLISDLL